MTVGKEEERREGKMSGVEKGSRRGVDGVYERDD